MLCYASVNGRERVSVLLSRSSNGRNPENYWHGFLLITDSSTNQLSVQMSQSSSSPTSLTVGGKGCLYIMPIQSTLDIFPSQSSMCQMSHRHACWTAGCTRPEVWDRSTAIVNQKIIFKFFFNVFILFIVNFDKCEFYFIFYLLLAFHLLQEPRIYVLSSDTEVPYISPKVDDDNAKVSCIYQFNFWINV